MLLGWSATHALGSILAFGRFAPLRPLTPDARVLFLSMVASGLVALVIAIVPALRAAHLSAEPALRRGKAVTAPLGRASVALLVVQVALPIVLAFGAGLLVRTLSHLQANDAVFRHRSVLWPASIR